MPDSIWPPRTTPTAAAARTPCTAGTNTLRQTLIALTAGTSLDEHESPGEATLQVLHGRVRLTSPDTSWDGHPGDHLVISSARQGLHAVDDCVVLLTVAKSVQRYGERAYDDDLPGL